MYVYYNFDNFLLFPAESFPFQVEIGIQEELAQNLFCIACSCSICSTLEKRSHFSIFINRIYTAATLPSKGRI